MPMDIDLTRIRAELERFREAMPSLLNSRYRGRWVVFVDGNVVADFDNVDDAETYGYETYGLDGDFVADLVEPKRVRSVGSYWVLAS